MFDRYLVRPFLFLSSLCLCVWVVPLYAGVATEPAAPPPPATYEVEVRYLIDANRNERLIQFQEMLRSLSQLGFDKAPGPDDEAENSRYQRMSGTIDRDRTRRLLLERHVKAIRLLPVGSKLPGDNAAVRVELELAATLFPEPGRYLYPLAAVRNLENEDEPRLQRQRLLADQVRLVLVSLGFREAIGYDRRAHTRLLGMVPANQLPALLEDLRHQPAAWKLPGADSVVLAGLRRYPEGEAVLEGILKDWNRLPAGAKLLEKLAAQWSKQQPGAGYLRTLPLEMREQPELARPFLLAHLAHRPESDALLQDLLKSVLENTVAPEFMGIVLRRLLPHPAAGDLPLLLRTDSPIRVTQVMPSLPLPQARPALAAPPNGQEKLAPELRTLVAAGGANPQRLEVILAQSPSGQDRSWERDLVQAAPGLIVEGQLGPLVSVLATPKQAPALAALASVSTVRLPRSGQPRSLPGLPRAIIPQMTLRDGGTVKLAELGKQGQPVRVVILDGDFRGWQALAGKQLPARTRLLDLTAERNPDLRPDSNPDEGKSMGHGTHCALAVARAAPGADLLLVRIDPAAPYQMLMVARAINGDPLRSINLDRRSAELATAREYLLIRRGQLAEEERAAFENFIDEEDASKRQAAYRKNKAMLEQDERAYQERVRRYLHLESDLLGLKDVRVVTSSLVWREGHPVDGSGPLSRYFDDRPFRPAFWFQAAGDTRGQSWAGLFQDRDEDGVMEYLPPGVHQPADLWRPDLAFLGWQPGGDKPVADLPAGARLRLSIQWREPHDPAFMRRGEDAYREPLAPLGLVVLRQLDPTGAKQPADDLAVVAQSVGLPQRLDNQPNAAIYEQTVEFVVKEAGRYAVQIEGRVWPGIRPRGAPTLPALEPSWELRPRLFVETLEGAGRAVLRDFATTEGSIGMPGDARRAITVGTLGPASAAGPVFNLKLLPKPTVLTSEPEPGPGPAQGTGLAASYAAGVAAQTLATGRGERIYLHGQPNPPEKVLKLPVNLP